MTSKHVGKYLDRKAALTHRHRYAKASHCLLYQSPKEGDKSQGFIFSSCRKLHMSDRMCKSGKFNRPLEVCLGLTAFRFESYEMEKEGCLRLWLHNTG